jgi:dephospho-CoA kinase
MSDGAPLVVGVAGKCCSGKDVVTNWLVDRGWRVVNVDAIGHRALAALHTRIVATFGMTILGNSRSIDRNKLGDVVFSDPSQLERLEAIVHPWMRERVREDTEAFREAAATGAENDDTPRGLVINAALLFHMSLDQYCDTVIFVHAPLVKRIARARRRDGSSWKRIFSRLRSQRSINAQARASSADIIYVKNGKRPTDLYEQLAAIPGLRSGEATRYGAE